MAITNLSRRFFFLYVEIGFYNNLNKFCRSFYIICDSFMSKCTRKNMSSCLFEQLGKLYTFAKIGIMEKPRVNCSNQFIHMEYEIK